MYAIDVRILGEEYIEKEFTGKDICEKRGIQLYFNTRDHRFSSSDLRKRVKNCWQIMTNIVYFKLGEEIRKIFYKM